MKFTPVQQGTLQVPSPRLRRDPVPPAKPPNGISIAASQSDRYTLPEGAIAWDDDNVLSNVQCPPGRSLEALGVLLIITGRVSSASTKPWWQRETMCWVELTASMAGWRGCDTHEPDICLLHFLARAHDILPQWIVVTSSEELGWMDAVC